MYLSLSPLFFFLLPHSYTESASDMRSQVEAGGGRGTVGREEYPAVSFANFSIVHVASVQQKRAM